AATTPAGYAVQVCDECGQWRFAPADKPARCHSHSHSHRPAASEPPAPPASGTLPRRARPSPHPYVDGRGRESCCHHWTPSGATWCLYCDEGIDPDDYWEMHRLAKKQRKERPAFASWHPRPIEEAHDDG